MSTWATAAAGWAARPWRSAISSSGTPRPTWTGRSCWRPPSPPPRRCCGRPRSALGTTCRTGGCWWRSSRWALRATGRSACRCPCPPTPPTPPMAPSRLCSPRRLGWCSRWRPPTRSPCWRRTTWRACRAHASVSRQSAAPPSACRWAVTWSWRLSSARSGTRGKPPPLSWRSGKPPLRAWRRSRRGSRLATRQTGASPSRRLPLRPPPASARAWLSCGRKDPTATGRWLPHCAPPASSRGMWPWVTCSAGWSR
mmetsp:Transcript_29100/g.93808  ORF Transcript_29100/g.93808 Transcript_29100/m.93808 type:complete len:254 (-) Transcript_29100:1177-1938(-)